MEDKINFLNKLIEIETDIYKCYAILADLEINGLMQDNKYNVVLNALNDLYERERNFLRELPNDILDINDLQVLIITQDENLKYNLDDQLAKDLIDSRILEHLDFHENNIIDREYDEYDDDYDDEYLHGDMSYDETTIEEEMKKNYALEFYRRLQERIDYSASDRKSLICEKYNMLYNFPVLDADSLCTGFNFKNALILDNSNVADCLGVHQAVYDVKYLLYMREIVLETLEELVFLEKHEEDENSKRTNFKIFDLQLEIALSYFGFINLYDLKE